MWGSVSVWVQKGAVEVEDKREGGDRGRGGERVDCEGGGAVETGKACSKDTGGGGYCTEKGKEGKNCVGSR